MTLLVAIMIFHSPTFTNPTTEDSSETGQGTQLPNFLQGSFTESSPIPSWVPEIASPEGVCAKEALQEDLSKLQGWAITNNIMLVQQV